MQTFLVVLLILAMIATVAMLVRGIVQFLKTTEDDLTGTGPNVSGQKQNKAMMMRVMFQAVAIILVVLIALASSRG